MIGLFGSSMSQWKAVGRRFLLPAGRTARSCSKGSRGLESSNSRLVDATKEAMSETCGAPIWE